MNVRLRYRGREVTEAEVVFLRDLIARRPELSRRRLSAEVCRAWDWRQENGVLRDMVCRGLLLALHRAGEIELPPVRFRPPNPLGKRRARAPVLLDRTPLRGPLADLGPLEYVPVRRTGDEPIFDALVEEHHYLGYTQPVGEQLKHLVFARGRPIACFAWSSAARHLGPRDRFIGWSAAARRANIRFLACNTRFLLLPWVEVPHLASHLLGAMARRIAADWEALYGHPVYYLESFVEVGRFRGTCYRAANWVFLGKTTGRGNNAPTKEPRVPVKEVLGLPLTKRFREILGAVQ